MNGFLIRAANRLLVVYKKTVIGFSAKDYHFLFREELSGFVLDYAQNQKGSVVLLLLDNGRVLEYHSANNDFSILADLNLFNPRMHALSYGIHFDPRSGFIVSGPFDGKETVFAYDPASKHYSWLDARPKSNYAFQSVLDRSELMIFGPDGQILCKRNRSIFSSLRLPPRKEWESELLELDPDQMTGNYLYYVFRYACALPDDPDVLLTLINGVALVRGVPDAPDVVKHVRCNNPLFAMWSPYSKRFFVVKCARGELCLYKDFEEIMMEINVHAYCFMDPKTFAYLDDSGVHIMDMEKEAELYFLSVNQKESHIGWRSYDEYAYTRYYL